MFFFCRCELFVNLLPLGELLKLNLVTETDHFRLPKLNDRTIVTFSVSIDNESPTTTATILYGYFISFLTFTVNFPPQKNGMSANKSNRIEEHHNLSPRRWKYDYS